MIPAIPLLLIAILSIGCSKEKLKPRASVEVYDYITGQPVQAVEIFRQFPSNYSLGCYCYTSIKISSLGFTGLDGKLSDIWSLDSIYVRKDKYLTAKKDAYCISEMTANKAIFHIFRAGLFGITATTTQNYTSLVWLKVYPVLKDGNLPNPFYPDSFWLSSSTIFKSFGYGGLTNRFIVLKASTTSIPDTLYKTDVFLPENVTKQLTINY